MDEKNYTFIVLTSAQYPSRALSILLKELSTGFYDEHPIAATSNLAQTDIKSEFLHNTYKKHLERAEHDGNSESYRAIQQKMQECQLEIKESIMKANAANQNQIYVISIYKSVFTLIRE